MRLGGRTRAAAALVAAAAQALPAPASAAECRAGDERLLAQNAYVQVVGGPAGDFACLRATGRRHALGTFGDARLDRVILRAWHVAYTFIWHDGEAEGTDLELLDASTGASRPLDGVAYAGEDVFGSIALKANGSTAWIVDEGYGWEPYRGNLIAVKRCSQRCLRTDPRNLRPTLVDHGRGVAMRSLRLHGSKISWLRGGRRHRATLR